MGRDGERIGNGSEAAGGNASEPITILLVDDRRDNLRALRAILTDPSYRLITATSGNEALQIALREKPTVILLDAVMPEMDGFEVARHLKSIARTRAIPILFLTAIATEMKHVHRAFEAGAVDYLIKPLDAEVVRKKVAVFVDLVLHREAAERQARRLRDAEKRELELRLTQLRTVSERRYRTLIEGIDHAIGWAADQTLRLTFVTRQAERILGFPVERFLEPDFWEKHLHPDDRDRVLTAFRRALAEGLDVACNHRLVADDGRALWFQTAVIARGAGDGGTAELQGISVDVTALKQAGANERFLAEVATTLAASLDYRAALGKLAQAVVPYLGDWCVIDEVTKPETLCQVAAAHVDPARLEALRALDGERALAPEVGWGIAHALRTGRAECVRPVAGAEWLERALGAPAHAELGLATAACLFAPLEVRGQIRVVMTIGSSSPRRLGPDQVPLVEAVASRASLAIDNALLYEEARRASEAREEVLAIVSHDLRSPLTALILGARMLESKLAHSGGAEVNQFIRTILRTAERMERLIADLLDLSKIQAGQLVVVSQPVDVAGMVQEALEAFGPLARQKGVRLEGGAPEGLRARGDRNRLLEVLSNLIDNAVKFTPAGGSITVRGEAAGSEVMLSVADTGPGIPEELRPHIWERFWQAKKEPAKKEPAKKEASRGLGLGLAIVKGLVEAHGGRIWVESQLGKGSTFRFVVPQAQAIAAQEESTIH